MLSGEGNENGKKTNTTTIGPTSKKATLHVQHFFCTFLCRCFARLLRKTSRKFLVIRSHGGNVGRVLVHSIQFNSLFTLYKIFT